MSRATWGWAHGALLLVVAAGALAVAIAADGARAPRRVLARLSSPALLVLGLLAAVVVAKAAFAAGRVGVAGPGRYLVVHLLAVVGVAVVASRRDLHLPVLAGYLVGVTTSAVVSLAQALDLLEPHWPAADRFPGWAATTPQLSWQLALAVSFAFRLDGTAQAVLVLQGAMPAAVFNYLFAARYGRDADDVASIVLVSTVLAALTMPLLVAFVLRLAA